MADYLRRHCGIPAHEAGAVREHYWRRYGATLIGVMRHHGADPGHFLRETHDAEALAAEVRRGPGLRVMLARLPGRKLVFSNSPVHYSVAVLAALGIADLFDDVFAVEHTGYRPNRTAAVSCGCCASTGCAPAAASWSRTHWTI